MDAFLSEFCEWIKNIDPNLVGHNLTPENLYDLFMTNWEEQETKRPLHIPLRVVQLIELPEQLTKYVEQQTKSLPIAEKGPKKKESPHEITERSVDLIKRAMKGTRTLSNPELPASIADSLQRKKKPPFVMVFSFNFCMDILSFLKKINNNFLSNFPTNFGSK